MEESQAKEVLEMTIIEIEAAAIAVSLFVGIILAMYAGHKLSKRIEKEVKK